MAIAEGLGWVGDSKGLQEGEGPTEAKRVEVWSSDSPEGSNGGWCGLKLKKKKKVEGTGKEGDERDDP